MKRKYICMKEKIMWRTGLMPESRCQEPHSCGISKKCTNSEPKSIQALQKCSFSIQKVFVLIARYILQKENTENFKQIFPEKELRGLRSQFPHSCVCERFIYLHNRSAFSAAEKQVDRSWEYINRSQTHECGNWDWGRAVPFFGNT